MLKAVDPAAAKKPAAKKAVEDALKAKVDAIERSYRLDR